MNIGRKCMVIVAVLLGKESSSGYKITCPKLECMGNDPKKYHPDTNICFEHDENVPTKKLIGQDCQYHQDRTLEFTDRVICDFDLTNNQFAWVEEKNQHLSGSSTYQPITQVDDGGKIKEVGQLSQEMSPMKNKKTTALCRSYTALNNNKMAWRNCTSHDECYTMKCNKEKGRCEGRMDTHTCYSHADCDAPFFCNKDSKYPYVSTCKTLKTSYAPCQETKECLHTLYCWYADVKESPVNKAGRDNKQCLPMYSQELGKSFGWYADNWEKKLAGEMEWTFEDFEQNGRYCNTGLAFLLKGKKDPNDGRQKLQSVCAAVEKITQGGKELKSPYECDPTDNANPCVIYPKNILEDKGEVMTKSFEVPCQCALDGKKGYCSSIIGTEEYKLSSSSQYLQREKSRCHTMDRDNYVSWLDCSTESNMDNIMGAINWAFNITHWPYIHDQEVKECMQELSRKSWKNIQALQASTLAASVAVMLIGLVVAQ